MIASGSWRLLSRSRSQAGKIVLYIINEFGQDEGLTRNTWGLLPNSKRPTDFLQREGRDFYRSHCLKITL